MITPERLAYMQNQELLGIDFIPGLAADQEKRIFKEEKGLVEV